MVLKNIENNRETLKFLIAVLFGVVCLVQLVLVEDNGVKVIYLVGCLAFFSFLFLGELKSLNLEGSLSGLKFSFLTKDKSNTESKETTKKEAHQNIIATLKDNQNSTNVNLKIGEEEHNLNFGFALSGIQSLEEVPDITLYDNEITQKGISFSSPYEWITHRRKKYVPIRLNNPSSLLPGDVLKVSFSRANNPTLEVTSVIQLQPNGNHTVIPIKKK